MTNCFKVFMISLSLLLSLTNSAFSYPEKDIQLIVPFNAGGGTDAVAHALANSSKTILGVNIKIKNRTGAAGAVGMSYGARQKADGYTLTVVTREIASLPQMGLMQHSVDDFRLIQMVNLDPAVIIVSAKSPFRSIQDLIKAAQKSPEQILFASTAAPNFYLMALEKGLNIKLNAIPHNGAAEAIPSIIKHHTQVTMITPGEALTKLNSGELRALGVTSEKRIPYLPKVPTLNEQGYEVITGTWRGIGAPKGTPDEVIKLLEKTFAQAMESPEFKQVMLNGAMTPYPLTGQAFTEFVKQDIKNLSELLLKQK